MGDVIFVTKIRPTNDLYSIFRICNKKAPAIRGGLNVNSNYLGKHRFCRASQ